MGIYQWKKRFGSLLQRIGEFEQRYGESISDDRADLV